MSSFYITKIHLGRNNLCIGTFFQPILHSIGGSSFRIKSEFPEGISVSLHMMERSLDLRFIFLQPGVDYFWGCTVPELLLFSLGIGVWGCVYTSASHLHLEPIEGLDNNDLNYVEWHDPLMDKTMMTPSRWLNVLCPSVEHWCSWPSFWTVHVTLDQLPTFLALNCTCQAP